MQVDLLYPRQAVQTPSFRWTVMPESDQLAHGVLEPASRELSGRTVLVTGAGSDLGATCCLSLAKLGADLLLLDRKKRLMEEVCQQVDDYLESDPAIIEFELSKAGEADCQILAEGLAGLTRALDGVVHCGLAAWPLAPVMNSKVEHWHQIHDREAVRPMVLIRSLYPLLKESGSASVVFCTMSAGRQGRANWGALGSAFASLENISETLATEWGAHNIRVNTVDISSIPSALRTRYYPGEVNQKPESGEDHGLARALGDLLRSDSTTSGQRMTL
ncbi:MAG: SDR family oxidoreductase [Gammaproteobacteria bacterium]|nr:SDR family oxidoreductase [Gammaproteobacteria bacterium]